MAPTRPVPADGNDDKKKKKKPLKSPLPDQRKRKKKPADSEVKSPSPPRKKKKKTSATPHEQHQPPPPSLPKKQKPLPFQRTWTPNDEVRILEAMAAHRQAHGKVPTAAELFPALQGHLDRTPCTHQKLNEKLRSFMRRHARDAKNGAPNDPHDRRLYDLSRNVWLPQPPQPPIPSSANANSNDIAAAGQANDSPAGNVFDKMRQSSYPNLTQAVMLLVDAEARPADLETALAAIADTKAQALDLKVSNLKKELTQAIVESARTQSTESPKIMCCPSTKLHVEFGAEIENFQLEHLDETEGTQVKLARMEQEILELKQNFLAFQSRPMADSKQLDKSSAKGIICESSESGLGSVVADNQILCNTLQTKMVIEQKLSCGKTKEVTSKHRYPWNLEIQKMMYGQRKIPYGRKKIDAGSQTKRNVELRKVTTKGHQEDSNKGGKEVLLLSTTWPHVPVAKATLQTSSGSTIVGGMPLGSECYQVFVNDVLKAEAPLLRPTGMRMAEALKSFIAWPCAQVIPV